MIKAEIVDSELIDHIHSIEKDGMSIFIMANGLFRGALFHGTEFINQMKANHALGTVETLVLGQASLCAALMIPSMKGREHVRFRYDTRGPAAGFSVEADSSGYVRGFLLQDPIPVSEKLNANDLSPLFGEGTVKVTRFLEGNTEPITGSVEIKYKNISQDLAWYFLQSEQLPTAFNTGIQLDEKGRVVGAGGLYLQVMPGASDELIQRVENAFRAAPSLGQWFSEKGDRDDIIYGLFREFEPSVILERDVVFNCPCTHESFLKRMLTLDTSELEELASEDTPPVAVTCHNCGSIYTFEKSELKK